MKNKKIILSLILTLTVNFVFAEGQAGMGEWFDKLAIFCVGGYTIITGILVVVLKKVFSKKITLKTIVLSFLSPLVVFTFLYLLIDSIFFVLSYILIKNLFG